MQGGMNQVFTEHEEEQSCETYHMNINSDHEDEVHFQEESARDPSIIISDLEKARAEVRRLEEELVKSVEKQLKKSRTVCFSFNYVQLN